MDRSADTLDRPIKFNCRGFVRREKLLARSIQSGLGLFAFHGNFQTETKRGVTRMFSSITRPRLDYRETTCIQVFGTRVDRTRGFGSGNVAPDPSPPPYRPERAKLIIPPAFVPNVSTFPRDFLETLIVTRSQVSRARDILVAETERTRRVSRHFPRKRNDESSVSKKMERKREKRKKEGMNERKKERKKDVE